ncbi:MAG: hypothetical protein OQJ89_11095 [Kangiellaceae bacterium]|nr:hypothetical protein [Kangiellaceae bacterium]MCW9000768.1 hypothetical protein [Kangiellaceae bacterium]MCW9017503.1 hypothetical protein [Kangiellaceae bacterium]
MFVKVESANPIGLLKDRLLLGAIAAVADYDRVSELDTVAAVVAST